MSRIEAFFVDIDRQWAPTSSVRTPLSIIGCGALMLQVDYERGTKDSDVFETTGITQEVRQQLLGLAGTGTRLHKKHRLYVDLVENGIPFLPSAPRWNPVPALTGMLTHFEVLALDVVDVVVSKLKRFKASDIDDVAAMIERGLVSHEHLVARFTSAFETFRYDARAADLPAYVQRLNQVERDLLGAAESEFDLESLKY